MVSKMYHVFHVVVEEGSHARGHMTEVMRTWTDLLGQRVLKLSDHTKLSEVIVSAIQVVEGADKAAVAKSWSGTTSVVVSRAISDIMVAGDKAVAKRGVVRL